jgi:BlaI family transcriptional regulator, penicillinase repressor
VPRPEGKLTPAQFEIIEIVWDSPSGITVADIWKVISARRGVRRTTVLNLVDRLEARGWLKRRKSGSGFQYSATVDRQTAALQVATEFVHDFFGGSTAELVMSLLGNRRISPAEVARLREMLDEQTATKRAPKGEQS